jgi:hypothetical protein
MFTHTSRLLLLSYLVTGVVWAANASFIGEWKLNAAKSKLTDQMKVERIAGNKYTFDFGGGSGETIVPDGTDQPGLAGTTLSITVKGPDSWKVVRKQEGRVLISADWQLSKDGKTLTDDFTQFGPNGSSTNVKYLYQRTAGGSGFGGTWESTSEKLNSVYVVKVQPYEADGLSFVNSSQGVIRNVTFDGKELPLEGPNAPSGSKSSARRVSQRTLEITTRIDEKVVATQEATLSDDGKTMTVTVHPAGRTAPNVLIFERQ